MACLQDIRCLFFDWGDTLMADDPSQKTPMVLWDTVSAMPGVVETLPILAAKYRCAVISNAGQSDAELMRQAFARAGLDKYFVSFLTSRELQAQKPALSFFQNAMKQLQISAQNAVMIGNDYEKDIVGAKTTGMRTVLITRREGLYPMADYVIRSFPELKRMFLA